MMKEMSNPEIIRTLGARLRQYRLNQNMTQRELSEKTNISLPTIQKLERGESYNITFSNLLTILRHNGLIENADRLVPEQPESPYRKKNPTRIRHGNKENTRPE